MGYFLFGVGFFSFFLFEVFCLRMGSNISLTCTVITYSLLFSPKKLENSKAHKEKTISEVLSQKSKPTCQQS